MTNGVFELRTTEYRVQQYLLVKFKTHRFSLFNCYNFPIYRFKHGFQRSKIYLIIYKWTSDGTFCGSLQLPWAGRYWIHRWFFQLKRTLSGHQEHEDFHTLCCCSARHARYCWVPGDPIPPCIVSAKCYLRLKVASLALHYYHTIGQDRTMSNMNYTQVLRTFYIDWEALVKILKETKPNVRTFPITSLLLSKLSHSRIACSAPMGFVTAFCYLWSGTLLRSQMKHLI